MQDSRLGLWLWFRVMVAIRVTVQEFMGLGLLG